MAPWIVQGDTYGHGYGHTLDSDGDGGTKVSGFSIFFYISRISLFSVLILSFYYA